MRGRERRLVGEEESFLSGTILILLVKQLLQKHGGEMKESQKLEEEVLNISTAIRETAF